MIRRLALLAVVLASSVLAGCAMPSRGGTTSSTRAIRSDGTVGVETRSALNGSTEPGSKQEILGLYIPFIGTGLAIKAGLEYDPGAGGVITIPIGGQTAPAPYAVGPCGVPQAAAAPCSTTRTVMVEETYMETEMRQVPRTRLVPRTVTVPAVSVPIPAPQKGPCDPTPPPCPATACDPRDPNSPCHVAQR